MSQFSHFAVVKEHEVLREMSKRKAYDVSFQLKAVECAEKKSKEAAAREMGVDGKRIREWCKQKKTLASLKFPDYLINVMTPNNAFFHERTRCLTRSHFPPRARKQ